MKKLIFIVLIGLTSMQAFAHNTFADTGVGVHEQGCYWASRAASQAAARGSGYTITSKSIGSCEKNIEGDYMVRWAVTGYYGSHSENYIDHSHSGSSNAQSGSAKSFTTKKSK